MCRKPVLNRSPINPVTTTDQEPIKLRQDFSDIDVAKTACLEYELSTPLDFATFAENTYQTVVLRNKTTKNLERLTFKINGGNKTDDQLRWREVWGEILTDDMDKNYCCLCFYFDPTGQKLERIAASFCAPYLTGNKRATLSKVIKKHFNRYPAEFTALDLRHPLTTKYFGSTK